MSHAPTLPELAAAYSKRLVEYYADEANPKWRAEILANCAAFKERFSLRPTKHVLSYYGHLYPRIFDHFETHVMHGAKDGHGHPLYMFVCAPYLINTDPAVTEPQLTEATHYGLTLHDVPLYHHACAALYRIGALPALRAWLLKPEGRHHE